MAAESSRDHMFDRTVRKSVVTTRGVLREHMTAETAQGKAVKQSC